MSEAKQYQCWIVGDITVVAKIVAVYGCLCGWVLQHPLVGFPRSDRLLWQLSSGETVPRSGQRALPALVSD